MKQIVFDQPKSNLIAFDQLDDNTLAEMIVIMKQGKGSYGILSRIPDDRIGGNFFFKALNYNFWNGYMSKQPSKVIEGFKNPSTKFYIFESIQEMCDWISVDIQKDLRGE